MSSVVLMLWNPSNSMQTYFRLLSDRTARNLSCQRLMDNLHFSRLICQNRRTLSKEERTSPAVARPTTGWLHQTARPAKLLRASLGMRMGRVFLRAATASTLHCTMRAKAFSYAAGKFPKTCHLTEPRNFSIVGS